MEIKDISVQKIMKLSIKKYRMQACFGEFGRTILMDLIKYKRKGCSMARFTKIKSHGVGRLFLHNNRTSIDGVEHSNETIDLERTYLNYHLKKGTPQDVTDRLEQVFHTGQKNETVIGEIVVTLPDNVDKSDERAFFKAVYDFYCEDFGEENIINAAVHKDETQPHIHIDFVPIIEDEATYEKRYKYVFEKWKQEHNHESEIVPRLCCNDLINRKYLATMHPRLSEYLEERLGYECNILNGATANGNKSVMQLKAESLQREIEEQNLKKEVLEKEVQAIIAIAEKHGLKERDIGLLPLMLKIDDLENQNKVYRDIINRSRYSYTKQDLETLKGTRYYPSLSSKVNVFDGRMFDTQIDDNALVVIEVHNKERRPLPLQKWIDGDAELFRQIKMAGTSSAPLVVRDCKKNNQKYIFLKTDNEKDTAIALLELQKRLADEAENWKGRRIFMEHIGYDEYDLGRAVLDKAQYDTCYFTGRDKNEEQLEHEHQIQKT